MNTETSKEVGFRIVRFGDVRWEPRTEDEWPCLVKRQLFDEARNLTIRIVWYARGAVEPRHIHGGTHAAFPLLGEAQVDGKSLGPWDVVYGPGNVPHGALVYPNGCMLFATLSGGALHTAVGDQPASESGGIPAQAIFERDIPWEKLVDPAGVTYERKLLMADPGRDYTAALVRWPAGSVDRRHSHAGTHAALVLQGRAVVDGVELGPWDLIYGPGGVPHGPISYPEGCVLAVSAKGDVYHRQAAEG